MALSSYTLLNMRNQVGARMSNLFEEDTRYMWMKKDWDTLDNMYTEALAREACDAEIKAERHSTSNTEATKTSEE